MRDGNAHALTRSQQLQGNLTCLTAAVLPYPYRLVPSLTQDCLHVPDAIAVGGTLFCLSCSLYFTEHISSRHHFISRDHVRPHR
jgi:hypothetical protein